MKVKFRVLKRLLKRGIHSKSIRRLLLLIQICLQESKMFCRLLIGFDPIVQKRQFQLLEMEKNLSESPVVIKNVKHMSSTFRTD